MSYSLVYVAGMIAFELTEEGRLIIWYDGGKGARQRQRPGRRNSPRHVGA